MGNAVHAAFVEEIAGQTVVVTGCGPIGLMAIAIARLAGARASSPPTSNPERLEMARRMGADVVIDAPRRRGRSAAGRDRRRRRRRRARDVRRRGGPAPGPRGADQRRPHLAAGHPRQPATIDLSEEVIFKGIRVYGITGRLLFETWYRTTALLEEGLDVTPIITHRLPLADYRQAFDLVAAGHAGKVVLLPQED